MSDQNSVEYPWLKNAWQQLIYWYQTATLPHAFLLIGSAGIGKTMFLSAWEQLLLCQTPKERVACQQCRACLLYQYETHPDSYHLGKKSNIITINEIRELLYTLSKKPHQAGRRLVTLWGVDQLSLGSANALLKISEEPPENTFFMLVAEKSHRVLPTIKSRCVAIAISPPSASCAFTWLKSKSHEYQDEALRKSLRLTGNAPLKAKVLLDSDLCALDKALHSASNRDLYDKRCQQFIAHYPKEALYFLYYELVEKIRSSDSYHFSESSFIFLDKLIEGVRTLSLPGINKTLLFESLFFAWRLIKKG